MISSRHWVWVAGILAAGGVFLAVSPRYVPRPSDTPAFAGTYWFLGVPLLVAALGILLWTRSREAAPAGP